MTARSELPQKNAEGTMHMRLKTTPSSYPLARLLGVVAAAIVTSTASAQTDLIITEFNEDDQPGFDLWPVPLAGGLMTAQFGAITVDVSTNTSFAHPVDRGSVNGTPPRLHLPAPV